MAQQNYAEEKNIVDCSFYQISGGGLSYMTQTWMGGYNDGWAWNNYWTYGQTDDTSDHSCQPNHEHDFDAFRQDLKTLILNNRLKPALISEADLFDPCGTQSQPEIPDKGGLTANQNGASAAWSIKQFISQEQGAQYVAIWKLTNGYSNNGSCPASGNAEYAWHAAYVSYATYERYWFYQWWMDTNQP